MATPVALYRTNELPSQLERALVNGVSEAELAEPLTHLACYAGGPKAMSAIAAAKRVFAAHNAT